MTHPAYPTRVVVADATPLNYLVQLEAIDFLQVLFGKIFVPSAVMGELLHMKSRAPVQSWCANLPAWVAVVEGVQTDPSLPDVLGRGEREAISLAMQLKADLVLIDEIAGRRVAIDRNLAVAGTLAVLLDASMELNRDFPTLLQRLRLLGFRMSEELHGAMLARYSAARTVRES